MLEGGAHAARRIYFKPCLSWWYERLLRGFNKQIRGFFFGKVHHAGQPHCVRLIRLQNHWHGQTTERTQRCRDTVICLRSPKYLWPSSDLTGGATKDTSAQGAWRAQSVWMDPGVTGYLPGPAVHTGLGGASLDSEWLHGSRTQGRTELGLWVLFVWSSQCLL